MSLNDRIELMKKYLLLCYEKEDWHGCMDVAADIRELLTEKRVREAAEEEILSLKSRIEDMGMDLAMFVREKYDEK